MKHLFSQESTNKQIEERLYLHSNLQKGKVGYRACNVNHQFTEPSFTYLVTEFINTIRGVVINEIKKCKTIWPRRGMGYYDSRRSHPNHYTSKSERKGCCK